MLKIATVTGSVNWFNVSLSKKEGQEAWMLVETMCPLHNVKEPRVSCVNEVKLCYGQNKEAPKRSKVIEASEAAQNNKAFSVTKSILRGCTKDKELKKVLKRLLRALKREGSDKGKYRAKLQGGARKTGKKRGKSFMEELEKT